MVNNMKKEYSKPLCFLLDEEVNISLLTISGSEIIDTNGQGTGETPPVITNPDEPADARGYSLFGDDDF